MKKIYTVTLFFEEPLIITWRIRQKKPTTRFSMNVKKAMNCINFAGVLHDALAFHNAMHMITEKWFFFLFVKHCFHF